MIGVFHSGKDKLAVEEFFQLFKTPWEWWEPGRDYDVVIATGACPEEASASLIVLFGEWGDFDSAAPLRRGAVIGQTTVDLGGNTIPVYCGTQTFDLNEGVPTYRAADGKVIGYSQFSAGSVTLRLGFDLFKEVHFLLSTGQPLDFALVPTLDLHVRCLRKWMLEAGVTVAEIAPTPAGSSFAVCLTHDIDFIGIRQHWCDHTMFGFLARATAGSLWRFARGRCSFRNLCRSLRAALSLPLVHLGLVKDFWMPFEWYLDVEDGLAGTYYFIPFRGRPGEKVATSNSHRRAAAYDLADLADWLPKLEAAGCEIGIHGIDAWHDDARGEEERQRIDRAIAGRATGIRMHWLLWASNSPEHLESAGYDYDSTFGYNETPGYRAGTCQVFRPLGATHLLELPLHIQDGALFYPKRLDLSAAQASELCEKFIDHARRNGGVLTLLWHDRSHGPERFWGEFYKDLIGRLQQMNVWFANARVKVM